MKSIFFLQELWNSNPIEDLKTINFVFESIYQIKSLSKQKHFSVNFTTSLAKRRQKVDSFYVFIEERVCITHQKECVIQVISVGIIASHYKNIFKLQTTLKCIIKSF